MCLKTSVIAIIPRAASSFLLSLERFEASRFSIQPAPLMRKLCKQIQVFITSTTLGRSSHIIYHKYKNSCFLVLNACSNVFCPVTLALFIYLLLAFSIPYIACCFLHGISIYGAVI